jgi:deazaflavin-dependent oxidoreductase (nitroreductase family)
MANPRDRITRIINTVHQTLFTLSKGRVGGTLMGMPVVLLTTTGRKSGQPRRNMVGVPLTDGDNPVLIASFGGQPNHPQWYLNMKADSRVEITRGGQTVPMTARITEGAEREALWARAVADTPDFEKYQAQTKREIPIVVVEPRRD